MADKPLRVVGPDDTAPSRRKLTITEAAAEGTTLELLLAMEERVAKAVEDPNCPPRDLAALTRRQMEIRREIDSIRVREAEDAEDAGAATPDDAWEAV